MPEVLINELNAIRESFLDSLDALNQSDSFSTLRNASSHLNENYTLVSTGLDSKLLRPFENRFVLAVAGSSGHGKTTILSEMFPNLARRGWLVTDVTDTTSQSLRIEYAQPKSPDYNDVVVNSWSIEQIKKLFSSEDVEHQNRKDNILVDYKEDHIEVDGNQASFSQEDLQQFRFPKIQTLIPFSEPYYVPNDQAGNTQFIRSLTTKEPSNKLQTKPILKAGNQEYNSLQLRVVVKDISLHDDFANFKRWTDLTESELSGLVFVDTPGIAVSGSVKDEIFRHALEYKSNQILLELLKNDELDILIHMVLCGRHSDFSFLWKALEKECGTIQMDDLAERLVLAINGPNQYFTNIDLKRHVDEGDHFEITIEENILQKMSPRGRIEPAKICFLDSAAIVENTFGFSRYKKTYRKYKSQMEDWLLPDSKPFHYLREQGWIDAFKENIEALSNPDDRGQGFLVREVIDLIREKGPVLLTKKYLIRTGLLHRCRQLYELLTSYYNEEGAINYQAAWEAVQQVFGFLADREVTSIDDFCAQTVDQSIDTIIKEKTGQDDWVLQSFKQCCNALLQAIFEKTSPPQEIQTVVEQYFTSQCDHWANAWGYTSARLPNPNETNKRTRILLTHSLKTHMREILYQLAINQSMMDQMETFYQTDEDKQILADLLKRLKHAIRQGDEICRQNGIVH